MEFKKVTQLLFGNFVSRGYILISIFFLTNSYNEYVLSEILYYLSLLTFFATVGPLRLETGILNSRKPNYIPLSYKIYSVFFALTIAQLFTEINYQISVILILLSLYANIGISLHIRNGQEKMLRNNRVIFSFLGMSILFINQWLLLDISLIFVVFMVLYFAPSFFSLRTEQKARKQVRSTLSFWNHIRLYLPNIVEMLIVTTSNYGLIFLLKGSLPDKEYTQIIIASQIYISSAVMIGSTISSKYLFDLNNSLRPHKLNRNVLYLIIGTAGSYILIAALSTIISKNNANVEIIDAIAAFPEISIVAISYVIAIPFSAIMLYQMRLRLNLLIHTFGIVIRLSPLIFMDYKEGYMWYIINSSFFYIMYGAIIYILHRRL